MTTIAQLDVIDKAFVVDLKALAAAESLAAAIAAGESPENIRDVCKAVEWGEDRLKQEVQRMRQVTLHKKAIAPGLQAPLDAANVEAEIETAHRWIREQKKKYNGRVAPLIRKLQVLSAATSDLARARLFLRDELLPRHIRDEINAIAEQVSPINANRARLEDEISKLKLQIPEDVVLLASMTVEGAREQYREKIARQNDERASIQRNREAQLTKVKQEMQVLLDRQGELRSTYTAG